MQDTAGCVMNIQRFCMEDGPGIRTTVFLKGCNLRCAWCHNPESWSPNPEIVINGNCVGCGTCTQTCPAGHLFLKDGTTWIKTGSCALCQKCIGVCPEGAIDVIGHDYTPEEIVKIISADKVFYRVSQGGVTFSGGEPMLRINFLHKVLTLCRDEEINTAVDTAGCVPWESFEKILPVTDMFLYDMKALTPEIHMKYVGADNRQILENLSRLLKTDKQITVCTPVIPNINDGNELEMMLAWLRDHGANRDGVTVKLIPYHSFGEEKYAHREKARQLGKVRLYEDEEFNKIENRMEVYGLQKSLF